MISTLNRLILSQSTAKKFIRLEEGFMQHLWVPDIIFHNMESFWELNSLMRNQKLFEYIGDKTFRFGAYILMKMFCPMNFDAYPIDVHTCHLKVVSMSNQAEVMNLTMDFLNMEQVGDQVTLKDYAVHVKYVLYFCMCLD